MDTLTNQAVTAGGQAPAAVADPTEMNPTLGATAGAVNLVPPVDPLDLIPTNPNPLPPPPDPSMSMAPQLPPMPSYDQAMDSLHGKVPPPTKFVEDWKSPEATQAMQTLRHALAANFFQASAEGGQALTNFFAGNPYSYMLGQSLDAMANTLQGIGVKNGMTDPQMVQHNTPENVINMGMYLKKQFDERTTGKSSFDDATNKRLEAWFPAFNANAGVRAGEVVMNNALALWKNSTDMMHGVANMKASDAAVLNAHTSAQQQKFAEQRWQDAERGKVIGETHLLGSQVDLARSQVERNYMETKLLPASEQAKNAATRAQANLMSVQAEDMPIRTALAGMSEKTQEAQTQMMVFNHVLGSAATSLSSDNEAITQLVTAGKDKVPPTPQNPMGLSPQYKNALDKFQMDKDYYDRARKSADTNSQQVMSQMEPGSVPGAVAQYPWLHYVKMTGARDMVSLAAAAAKDKSGFLAGEMFPTQPKQWNPKTNTFDNMDIDPRKLLFPGQVRAVYQAAIQPQSIMNLRRGVIPSQMDFVKANPGMSARGQDPAAFYDHYHAIMDYVRQMDHLLNHTPQN